MAQHHPSQLISAQKLAEIFCISLTPAEYQNCISKAQLVNPAVGKVWKATDTEAGIYIVVSGKVRLLDSDDEMIVALSNNQYFGEYAFFVAENVANYTARASISVQVCFIPQVVLTPLIHKYPVIREQFWKVIQERGLTSSAATDRHVVPLRPGSNSPVLELPIDQSSKKISKAYFPNPQQRVGHLWQQVMRRYPYFAQQSASDCGAACLVMVGRYWGKKFSVNRLRDIAHVDRNGSSLKGLSVAAESLGFTTRPVKISLDRLAKQPLPAIAHWQGKHYIVVYRITSTQVIVADPALGQRTLSYGEFKKDWTGYTLILQPTALLRNAEESSTPFWQFFELLKPHRVVVIEVFIASLFIQIFGLVTPLFTQFILDRVVVQKSETTLITVGIGLFLFSMFRVAMVGLRQYLLDHTANKLDLALIVAFIRHTMSLPLGFFESRYVGDIMSRVQENQKIQRLLSGEAVTILLDLLTVFIYLGLMFWYSWQMALISLLIVPPFLLLPIISTPFLRRISREIFGAYAEESSYLIQALTGIKTVKSTAVEQNVRWHWEELFHKAIKINFSGQIIGNRLQIFSNTINATV